jgi:D-glycero-D-manno-heptose 1,7-bisphosphate phosphatase
MTKAVFFDRDGVVNKRIVGGYVTTWDEFELLPMIGETLREVARLGYKAIVITNQRGVGLGRMSETDLSAIHDKLQRHLQAEFGVQFDDIISCTDATDDSPRRKPSPEMLYEAARKFDIDLSKSWMIGDSHTDIEAGTKAGTKTAFLLNDHEPPAPDATITLKNVHEIIAHLETP